MPVQTKKTEKSASTNSENKPQVHTGDGEFDKNRMKSKGFNDKPETIAKGDVMSRIGDCFDAVGKLVVSHDAGMILGYMGAGWCLYKSAIGWTALTGGNMWIGAPVALAEQYLELLPRIAQYFPEMADKLTFKLALTKFVDPTVRENHPTLLNEARDWGRDAHRKRQRMMETVSLMCYLMAVIAASMAFRMWDPRTMTLRPEGVFDVLQAVIGFEACMIFAEWMKSNRLTHRQSRQYNEMKRRQRVATEQELLNQ